MGAEIQCIGADVIFKLQVQLLERFRDGPQLHIVACHVQFNGEYLPNQSLAIARVKKEPMTGTKQATPFHWASNSNARITNLISPCI